MGALADKVRADMTEAMKAQEKERLSTLRMLQSALKNEQINVGHELSDEEAMSVIRKAMKQRQDSIEQYTKDRKSTRLNSSHGYISYAVFCLKKKKKKKN